MRINKIFWLLSIFLLYWLALSHLFFQGLKSVEKVIEEFNRKERERIEWINYKEKK
jgi:hypothetical protein